MCRATVAWDETEAIVTSGNKFAAVVMKGEPMTPLRQIRTFDGSRSAGDQQPVGPAAGFH
jgi:hypothetical protein